MGEETNIEWCDHSFNAWWGCTKVSPACDNCYAETWATRTGDTGLWGVNAGRRTFGEKHWLEPLKWDIAALKKGTKGPRPRVFCNSMADVFDNHEGVSDARARLFRLIQVTPALDWLILTKRIGNVPRMLPADWGTGYPNVWLGISVCEQHEADRDIPKLLDIPAAVRFLSCEPLLGRIDLFAFHKGRCVKCAGCGEIVAAGQRGPDDDPHDDLERCYDCMGTGRCEDNEGLDWVICGGESGGNARSMNLDWAQNLKSECEFGNIPFFMKQLSQADTKLFKHFESFPSSLRVREWPTNL